MSNAGDDSAEKARVVNGAQEVLAKPASYPEHTSCRKLVREYVTNLAAGGDRDSALETRSASRLGFDTFDLADVICELARARKLPHETVVEKMRQATAEPPQPGHVHDHGGWSSFPNLFARVAILADACLESCDREALLRSGVVGPGNEVGPFHESVTIGFIVRYCQEVLDLPIPRKGAAKAAPSIPQSRVPAGSSTDTKPKTIWPRLGLVALAIAVVCVLVMLLR